MIEKITTLSVAELQADEMRTIVRDKEHPVWVFTTIDDWSRLWPSTVVGRRSLPKHARPLSRGSEPNESRTCPSGRHGRIPVYKRVVRRILGTACLYGQVIKTRANDRIVKVERRALIGDAWRFWSMNCYRV